MDLIAVENQGIQPWTIGKITRNDPSNISPSNLNYYDEICSVNIVLSIKYKSCFDGALEDIFPDRMFVERNLFVEFLNSHQSTCKRYAKVMLYGYGPDTFYVLFMTVDYSPKLESAMAFCSTCLYEYKSVKFAVPTTNLYEMKALSNDVKSFSVEPTLAVVFSLSGIPSQQGNICKFFYKLRRDTRPDLIGCYPQNLFIENFAAKLNFSVVYPTSESARNQENFLFVITNKVHYAAVMLLFDDLDDERRSYSNIFRRFHFRTIPRYFLYCTKKPTRESFSLLFWTIPMDNSTWALVGLAVVILTIFLRGQWFEIFAIIMRQSCSILDKKKILMVFILATIIFTYGYEGVISSFITVPPPFKIFSTLSELLNSKYKIMIPDYGGNIFLNSDIYHALFKAENIALNHSNMGRYFQPTRGSESHFGFNLPFGNLTVAYAPEVLDYWQFAMWQKHGKEGLRCFRASKIAGPQIKTKYTFFGFYHSHMMRALQVLFESGVLGLYINFNVFVKNFGPRMMFEVLDYQDRRPAVFTMNDWKILSIFLILIFGLLVSLKVFATELAVVRIRKSRVVTKIIKL